MSAYRTTLAIALCLLIAPLEESSAQRLAPSGITRSVRVATDSTSLRPPRMPCYVKIAVPTLHGATIGFIASILFPAGTRAIQQQRRIILAGAVLAGAAVGVVEAKRAGCLNKRPPEPPAPVQGH